MSGAEAAPDGGLRCPWGLSTEDYLAYHDTEWGRSVHGDDALFERLCLEAFQSGLSWLTILRRREGFRSAFAGFKIPAVAEFTDADKERLLADAGIIRNRAKIEATLANAKVLVSWAAKRAGRGDLVPRPRPGRPPGAAHHRRHPRGHPRVHRTGQGPQEARAALRRTHHGLRADAGVRPGRRPPGRLRGTRIRHVRDREGRRNREVRRDREGRSGA